MKTYYENTQQVMEELSDLLVKIDNEQIEAYLKELNQAQRLFFVGVGRVKISLEATVKRFTHLGFRCHMVGDLNEPPITTKDLLIVGSSSGESLFPLEITRKAKRYGARIVHLTSESTSSIAQLADRLILFESPSKRNERHSIQPMTTIFEQGLLIFHDVLTLEIMKRKGLTFDELKKRHANLE